MIFLIFSRDGFEEACAELDQQQDQLWLNHGLLNAYEISAQRSKGIKIEQFNEAIDSSDDAAIFAAIEQLEKKFPKEEIQVEYL